MTHKSPGLLGLAIHSSSCDSSIWRSQNCVTHSTGLDWTWLSKTSSLPNPPYPPPSQTLNAPTPSDQILHLRASVGPGPSGHHLFGTFFFSQFFTFFIFFSHFPFFCNLHCKMHILSDLSPGAPSAQPAPSQPPASANAASTWLLPGGGGRWGSSHCCVHSLSRNLL